MKIAQIVFSPTGGTQKVADIITEGLGNTVDKIDLTRADNGTIIIEKYDIALIAVPSYGGRVPTLAAQRLSAIQANKINCIIVCVYGNRAYEDTLVELKDIATECGFIVVAAVSAVAEHSIMHQYATNRPDTMDSEELRAFAEKILKKIKEKNSDFSSIIPGNHPYKKTGEIGLVPKANSKCDNCGYCAKICPAQAIQDNNCKITDSKKCISCMRCVTLCPQKARNVNTVMVSVASIALKKICSERKSNELFI